MDVTGNFTSAQPLNVPFKIGEHSRQEHAGLLELRVEQATNLLQVQSHCKGQVGEVILAVAILHKHSADFLWFSILV